MTYVDNFSSTSIYLRQLVFSFHQWTSDQDVTDAVRAIGVNDFLDVKFFENRANGRSKGYCMISFASEVSMRLCMETLNKKELHGQFPIVRKALSQVRNLFHQFAQVTTISIEASFT